MYVYVSNLSYARAEKFKLFIKGYILFFIVSIKVFFVFQMLFNYKISLYVMEICLINYVQIAANSPSHWLFVAS